MPPTSTAVEVNGFAICEIRKAKGITTTALAALVPGLDAHYLRKIERGEKPRVRPEVAEALAEALHLENSRAILVRPVVKDKAVLHAVDSGAA